MKTYREIQAEECYWTIIYNCTIPIYISLLCSWIKSKIKGDNK